MLWICTCKRQPSIVLQTIYYLGACLSHTSLHIQNYLGACLSAYQLTHSTAPQGCKRLSLQSNSITLSHTNFLMDISKTALETSIKQTCHSVIAKNTVRYDCHFCHKSKGFLVVLLSVTLNNQPCFKIVHRITQIEIGFVKPFTSN